MLSEEEIQKVRLVLVSDGWNHVMKPRYLKRGNESLKALVLSPAERMVQYKGTEFATDDEHLRAKIGECEWMLAVWDNEVQVFEQNRRRDELAAGQQ